MPRRTNAFQRLVTLLTATLAERAEVTESAMLMDRVSGEPREVDILVVAIAGGFNVQLGVEVISWARPADTPWVEKMRAKHENLPTDKLILVSENGFYEPARRKAEFYGIEVLTLEEATEADWPLIATLEASGVFEVMTIDFTVSGVLQLGNGDRVLVPISRLATFPSVNGSATIGQFVHSILDIQEVRDVLRKNTSLGKQDDFWLSYSHPNGLWRFEENEESGQFSELRVGLKVLNSATPVRFASGKFRSVPFISGASSVNSPMQFVLARNVDGSASGYLIDESGVRALSSTMSDANLVSSPDIDPANGG
ncbi:hypothetical protein [Pseudomonas sihuiensis]|uniref:Restriction endonuclease n=1 Tax=Pseudomonas sihuiensis TaxID=1274359 RepID=A0A1H2LIL2_9PSED|nr:hypothetical protein [Pseudomonas sihuiensis]SDU80877.1 hypothetical protein SAMN05216363_1657 [Pseudomonas sihuiensis]